MNRKKFLQIGTLGVLAGSLAPSLFGKNKEKIEYKILPYQNNDETLTEPKAALIVAIILGIAIVTVGTVAIYAIIKAANKIPPPRTNNPEADSFKLSMEIDKDSESLSQPTYPGNNSRFNINIDKSYDNGRNWSRITTIFADPDNFEYKDIIINGIVPQYRAYYTV
jgi:hypothetical protein